MTFADWQTTYSGIHVRYPYPEAPDVALIEGRDPVNQGGPALFDRPLRELFDLSDYSVTCDNPHRGTVWIAPRVERDDWTRTDYMNHRVSHETYYLSLARCIGLPELERLVLRVASRERLAQAFAHDPHLNGIPLAKWDGLDFGVRELVRARNKAHGIMARSWCGQPLPPGTICWSLSESVCVTKAVARYLGGRG